MLDFDTMLMHVGEFGLYQKILFTFQAPFCIFVTFVLFGQLFMVLYPMNYWCDSHFKCITRDSIATPAQRRNISFVYRNGGLFRTDSCELNNIDDDFITSLHSWSNRNGFGDRSRLCPYDDQNPTRDPCSRSSPPTTRRPTQGGRVPSPKLARLDADYSDYAESRRERRYRPNPAWITPRAFAPTTTTQAAWNADNTESVGRQNWNNNYGQGQTGGGSSGGRYPPSEDYDGGDGYDWPTTTRPTTPRYTQRPTSPGNNPRPKPSAPGSTSSKPQTGRQMPVPSAFAGWPEPTCKKPRFPFILSNNTVILQDRIIRKFKNRTLAKIENCDIRWNLSEVPYTTIVTEGNWWCNAELYITISQAVFFLGAIVGGFLIGWIADTFGRVPALVIANILGAVGGALSAVSTEIWAFSVFRFITGMAFDNCFTMMYILVLEFCGPSYRTLVANLSIAIFYTLGTLLLPILAVWISNWKAFALAISLPMLLALLALFFVPESARWLLSKGRAKEATNILRNFAKVNRRKVDERVFVEFEQEATQLFSQFEQEEEEPSLVAAFRTPRLRRTFIILIIFWSLIALVYDGHSRNITNLANEDLNVFWMFGIASMTEFPADMLLIFTLDRFGRRWLAFGSMTLSGAFSFISAAITAEMRTPFLISAIISRFWVNVAFNIGLQYAAELLPTVIRAQGVNAIHIMGYVASILSPFVAAIGRSNPTLSLILLGAFAIAAGFVSLFLAETLGEDLPNTLEEAEAFGKNQSFWNCPICAKGHDDEKPIDVTPAVLEDRPVVLRNALRGSIRGETYRSSMISHGSSGSGSRNSRYMHPGGSIMRSPQPTETTQLTSRRITN